MSVPKPEPRPPAPASMRTTRFTAKRPLVLACNAAPKGELHVPAGGLVAELTHLAGVDPLHIVAQLHKPACEAHDAGER